jgi:hypothetical protein
LPGIYLCLPRILPPAFEPSSTINSDLPDLLLQMHDAFAKLPNARLRAQLPLLTYERLSDVTYEAIERDGTSLLVNRHVRLLMQTVVVKMSAEKERIRREVDNVEALRRVGEESSLHIGSSILRSQHTVEASTSFVVLRPVFGPNLSQYGNRGAIPGWFVGHICVGLLDAVEFVHDAGLVHGNISASNVVLNLQPSYMHHRYRGFPDVQLIGFSSSHPSTPGDEGKERDVRAMLKVMQEVVSKWSDVAPFLRFATSGGGEEGEDPLISLLRHVQSMLADTYDGPFDMAGVREQLEPRLTQMRHEGPQMLPRDVTKLLHSDLVTGPELERAVQDPLVLKFEAQKEEMRRIVEDVPVEMGGAGNAGTKTQGIMVMRFTSRKREFLEAIGKLVVEEENVEMGGIEHFGAGMEDVEMSAPGYFGAGMGDVEMSGVEHAGAEMVDPEMGVPGPVAPFRSLFGED